MGSLWNSKGNSGSKLLAESWAGQGVGQDIGLKDSANEMRRWL